MLLWIVILGILGLILVLVEALLPGLGIFGIGGGIALLCSTVLVGIRYGFGAFLVMVAGLLLLAILCIRFAKTKKVYNKVVLTEVVDTKDFDESILQNLEGAEGRTVTTVQPYGKAEFQEKVIDVCSEDGYIDRDRDVKIVSVQGKTVIVKEMIKE